MNLDDAQKRKVAAWIAEGLKLADIQNRIVTELGVRLTYMEVRLLADDLKLTPKDIDRPKTAPTLNHSAAPAGGGATAPQGPAPPESEAEDAAAPSGNVSVKVDQIARPGAVVSGKVSFSDGKNADWYFDQSGRLGLVPQQAGYRPSPADLQQFQMALESELSKMGM